METNNSNKKIINKIIADNSISHSRKIIDTGSDPGTDPSHPEIDPGFDPGSDQESDPTSDNRTKNVFHGATNQRDSSC